MTSPSQEHERKTENSLGEPDIISLARQRLESHPHFHHHHGQTVCIEWIDECLVLSGQLPSFHLKQLAQEALRGLEATIVNQIEVVSSCGLSSALQTTDSEQSSPANRAQQAEHFFPDAAR